MEDTLPRLLTVFRNVFDDETLTITPNTTAREVSGWDSLMHVTLLVNVEREFKIKFSSSEVARLENVGQLIALVDRRRTPATKPS